METFTALGARDGLLFSLAAQQTGCSMSDDPPIIFHPSGSDISPRLREPEPAAKSDFQRLHDDAFHALLDTFRAIAK